MSTSAKTTKTSAAKAKPAARKETATAKPAASKPAHPATSEMVNAAIGTLKDRKGCSLRAIKKYIASHYVVDVQRLSPFIKKYLKSAVEKNTIVQTAGVGASGRFKMAKPDAQQKTPSVKKTRSPATEKTASPSKAKKSGKAPAAKTKSPKPKKVNTK